MPILALRVSYAAVLVAPCLLLVASGCSGDSARDGDGGTTAAASAAARHTVTIELLPPAVRDIDTSSSGVATYRPLQALDDVEVCVWKQRAAFATFEPFTELPAQLCRTSKTGRPLQLTGVPASSDLLITYTKAGYTPIMITFRTDEYDVALPDWQTKSGAATYYVPLLRSAAKLPIEPEPAAADENGLVLLWVTATGRYALGGSAPVFNVDADPGVVQAEGVKVAIANTNGDDVADLASRRDRAQFVSLPEGTYRMRATHPLMELLPAGVEVQCTFFGLATDEFNSIEVPVVPGRVTLAQFDGYCPLPPSSTQPFADLATCTLGAPPASQDTP